MQWFGCDDDQPKRKWEIEIVVSKSSQVNEIWQIQAIGLYVRIQKMFIHCYTQHELFMLWLSIPVISAVQTYFKSRWAQNLSERDLNVLVDSAETTVLGGLLHIATIMFLKCLRRL